MYEFDPLTEFNSDGVNAPLFQFCERFETRFFSGWLLEQGYSHRQSIEIFRYVKQAAVTVLEEKKLWLQRHHADSAISDCVESLRKQYLTALESHEALENLFIVEMFRSHVFDIEDDLNGKSCTSTTIRRVNIVLEMVDNFYPLLQEQDALFFHNEGKSKEELMESYQKKLSLVKQYQL